MDSQIKGNLEDRLVRYLVQSEKSAELSKAGRIFRTIGEVRSAMKSDGYIIPTVAEIADVVSDCAFSPNGVSTIVAETVNYFPGKDYILIATYELNRHLPRLDRSPTSGWKRPLSLFRDKEYHLSRREQSRLLRIAKEDADLPPRERTVFVREKKEKGYFSMPRKALIKNDTPDSEFASFLYRRHAKRFAGFLRENGVAYMPFWLDDKSHIDSHRAPYARLLTFTVRSKPWNAHLLDGTHMAYSDSVVICGIKNSS